MATRAPATSALIPWQPNTPYKHVHDVNNCDTCLSTSNTQPMHASCNATPGGWPKGSHDA